MLLTLLLAALDQTIVGTAMPRIIAQLNGFDRYPWVTTAYLLTSTIAVPILVSALLENRELVANRKPPTFKMGRELEVQA